MKKIGVIHSPYKEPKDAPPQGHEDVFELEIYKEYEQGLKDLERFSHLHIFSLFEQRGFDLLVRTPWDKEKKGLFATRTPRRPNPIGYSAAELIEMKGNRLKVRGLDAIEGTPLLDIKPYIPEADRKEASMGWLENKYGKR